MYVCMYVCMYIHTHMCVCVIQTHILLGVERVGLKGVMREESGDVRPQVLDRDGRRFMQHALVRQSKLWSCWRKQDACAPDAR